MSHQLCKSNLDMYKEFNPLGKADITDGKSITIKGIGTVIRHLLLPDGKKFSMDIWQVLYVPEVIKWLFSLITAGRLNNISKTTRWGTLVSKNRIPFIIGSLCRNKLHYFDLELMRSHKEISGVAMTTVSCDYTLWHRRMGHAHKCVVQHLGENMEGGPNPVTSAPKGPCEGCEKGKSKRLPFPPSKSRAQRPLDLVHSNLDEFPNHSIGRFKWTTTYLDNHSSFAVIFYSKNKDEEFTAFKSYKAWAEKQLSTTLKCKQTD